MRGRLGAAPASSQLMELMDAPEPEATNDGPYLYRDGAIGNQPSDSNRLLSSLVGVPAISIYLQRYWRGSLSGIGSGARIDYASVSRIGKWPIGVDLSVVPAGARYPVRYELSVLVSRAPNAPVLGPIFGLSLEIGPNTIAMMSNTSTAMVGMSIESESAINAGRWTVHYRLLRLGALVSVDTGIDVAAVPQLLGLRYEHALVPSLTALIDGAPVVGLSGLANVPDGTSPTGSSTQKIGVGQNNIASVAGQQDRWAQARMTVAKLAGYPG